jgi:4,5-dihydroxyphthalate decarboxylase
MPPSANRQVQEFRKKEPAMPDLVLSFACTPYDRVMPLITGEVKPDGITLDYQGMPGQVPGVFYDQIKFHRFDLSEFSMSSFLRTRQQGLPYRMMPIFHNRQFSYTNIYIRADSGIRQGHPEDLKGKRIGIGDYQQSVGLWTRGSLLQEFGVNDNDMIWYQERGEHYSHSGASGLSLPHVDLRYAKEDFATMYIKGDLDASIGLGGPAGNALDRDKVDLSNDPRVTTLFANPREEAIRYFKKHGVYQPHHVTAIRESIVMEYPWVARSIMEAFQKSKEIAIARLKQTPPSLLVFGASWRREIQAVFGDDPFPYGYAANAKAIDFAQTFSYQQKLTERKQPIEEIFPEEILIMEERLPSATPEPVAAG